MRTTRRKFFDLFAGLAAVVLAPFHKKQLLGSPLVGKTIEIYDMPPIFDPEILTDEYPVQQKEKPSVYFADLPYGGGQGLRFYQLQNGEWKHCDC